MTSHDYPALFRAAEAGSASAQKAHYGTYVAFAVLSALGAGLAAFGIASRGAAVAAAVLFVGALFLSVLIAIKRFEGTWYTCRAVAESIKTNVWRFMMKAEPYAGDDAVAHAEFRNMLRGILREQRLLGGSLAGVAGAADQVTGRMSEIRTRSVEARLEWYQQYRIDEQRRWYSDKAAYNSKAATLWFWTLVGLQAGAVALTLARVLAPTWRYWPTEILVVAAGGVLGWTQAKRFQELASAYALTAHEIGLAKSESTGVTDQEALSSFVNQTEAVFSREHTQWVARRE